MFAIHRCVGQLSGRRVQQEHQQRQQQQPDGGDGDGVVTRVMALHQQVCRAMYVCKCHVIPPVRDDVLCLWGHLSIRSPEEGHLS